MKNQYDIIIIVETDFQKNIVDKMVGQFFFDKDYLIINARNNKIEIKGEIYHVNLGGLRWMAKSLKDIKKLPRLYAKELVGTHFTGVNCRFFESFIKYDRLSLIDDGIGTPAMLRHARFIKTMDWYFRLVVANVLVFLSYGKCLKTVNSLIKGISTYYTIYDFINNEYSDVLEDVEIIHVDYYSGYRDTKIVNGVACYIGSGINPNLEYCLKIVRERHQHVTYFPHPRENLKDFIKQYVDEIVRPNMTIEDYFKTNGAPEYIYGNMSSAFLNMKLAGLKSKMTVFTDSPSSDIYYRIFEENNISLYNLQI